MKDDNWVFHPYIQHELLTRTLWNLNFFSQVIAVLPRVLLQKSPPFPEIMGSPQTYLEVLLGEVYQEWPQYGWRTRKDENGPCETKRTILVHFGLVNAEVRFGIRSFGPKWLS